MLKHIPSLDKLVHLFSALPGVGPKTAQRLAYHVLKSENQYSLDLSSALHDVLRNVGECPSCFSYTEEESCFYCQQYDRSDSVICVVEDASDISRVETSGAFKGRYHVLQGALSPLEGIGPSDLRIQELMNKIKAGAEGQRAKVEEVILALDADLEGDTTVLYLAKLLKEKGVQVTRIAHGVPIGGDIDYIDHRTLGRALENRVHI